MERLTKATDDLTFLCDHLRRETKFDAQRVKDIHDRLAAYEDTGMEPEEIKDFMSRWKDAVELAGLCKEAGSDRLRELAEADKDGRCVVLPCSLGKKVWSGKWRDDLSECVYVCASSMLSDIERGNVIRYTRKAAEAALKAGDKS